MQSTENNQSVQELSYIDIHNLNFSNIRISIHLVWFFFFRYQAKNFDSFRDLHKILPPANYFLFIAAINKLNEKPWKSQYVIVKPILQLQVPLLRKTFKEMFIDVHYNPSDTIFNSNFRINWFDKTWQLNIYGLLVLAKFPF